MEHGRSGALGSLLRRYRRRAGLSQVALAARSGLTESAIGALERGARARPYPHTLDRLTTALGLTDAERAILTAAAGAGGAGSEDGEDGTAPSPHPFGSPLPGVPLPISPVSLVGRAAEQAALETLLCGAAARLVTLTGVGGMGKTRLALATAAAIAPAFPAGVSWVELAPLADGAMVAPAVARVLGVEESPGTPLLDTVATVVVDRSLLLVLDNCEHVIETCARIVAHLLSVCPSLRVLATSREPLQIAGEQQWPVTSLAVPAEDGAGSVEEVACVPSVQLFVERARSVERDFALTKENAPLVVTICRRLDGIPLALELAAARVRTLGVGQILERLDSSLTLLTGGSRTAPARQHTLRAALDWSYELLNVPERALFRRLAVFAGGWDLDAVAQLNENLPPAGDELWGPDRPGSVDARAGESDADPVDLLLRLVDRSLVAVTATGAMMRYRLLEPVRQYAAGRLAEAGEAAAARTHHAAWFLALAERAAPELRGPAQLDWLGRLDAEAENLRAALRWTQERGATVALARFAIALLPFWEVRGLLEEGRRWVDAALAGPRPLPIALRAWLLLVAARLAFWQVQLPSAQSTLDRAMTIAHELDDTRLVAEGLTLLGEIRLRQREYDEAIRLLEESLPLHVAAGNTRGAAWARRNLGIIFANRSERARAVSMLEESLREFRALGDLRAAATTAVFIGSSRTMLGDTEGGDAALREALHGLRAIGDRAFLASGLSTLAWVRAQTGGAVAAARLLAAGDTLRRSIGVALSDVARSTWDETVTAIRARISEAEYTAAYAEGESISLDEALAEALDPDATDAAPHR